MRIRFASLFLVAFSLVFSTRAAVAWNTKDHRTFVAHAIEHSPPELASFLRAHWDEVMRGSVDPDRKFMDTPNHTYHVDDGTRSAPDRVAELSDALVAMMRNGAPREKVAYWFGALSHYVSDIDQPLHTSDKDRSENWYHVLFEALGTGFESHGEILGLKLDLKVGKALSGSTFAYDGRHDAIDDVREWHVENARWAYGYYDEIARLYTEKGARDAERLAQVYRTCFGEAVNDVIDLWAHVFRAAASDPAALPPLGDVLVLIVDEKGRISRDGKRLAEKKLADALRGHASAYVEIDDRCAAAVRTRIEGLCAAAGVPRVSAVFVPMGPWTSRLFRAVKVHSASFAEGR